MSVVVVVVAFLALLVCGCDAVESTTADDLLGIFETLRLSSTEANVSIDVAVIEESRTLCGEKINIEKAGSQPVTLVLGG